VLRGGTGGSTQQALDYVNLLRQRAYGDNSGNLGTITLNEILNERMRELYWEGFRRTDLIRYGMFTGSNYLWPWKAGVQNGTGVADHFALFPIPATEIISNPNLVQNDDY
jgi:starch-binding outer membrane protein, SusD/RagB family